MLFTHDNFFKGRLEVGTVNDLFVLFPAAVELAVHTLDEAAVYFSRIDCKERMRDVFYLQARLYHSLGDFSQRNKSAMLFRLLDQELPLSGMTVVNRL